MNRSAKSIVIHIRTQPETRDTAEKLFSSFGITLSDAVNIFLHQSLMVGGLPFEMRRPYYNQETEPAFQEAGDMASVKISAKSHNSAGKLFDELDKEC